MDKDTKICFCNNVTYGEILHAIHFQNAKVQEDIERITGASSRCGRCRRRVIKILEQERNN